MKHRTLSLIILALISLSSLACVNATEGIYKIQTIRGQISRVIKPHDGWVNTMNTVGNEEFDFNIRVFTVPVHVTASTQDNAAVAVNVSASLLPPSDDEGIKTFVRKFGLDENERWDRMTAILKGQMMTEAKNAIVSYNAYGLLANQEAIQKRIFDVLKPILKEQCLLDLQSIQITERPDFVDDRIEQAASSVVANQKAKEAAEAELAKAKVDAEKKQVEALTFANPALLALRKLELQLEIERARADGIKGHNGPLTIVNGSDQNTQLQLRGQ